MTNALFRCFLISWILVGTVMAQEIYRPMEGAIPLQYGGYPASDLVLDGRVLLPDEAHNYFLQMSANTRKQWTLAELSPEPTDIWQDKSYPLGGEADELPVKDQLDEVNFVSFALTRLDNYRFTVMKDQTLYSVYMGPKIHNFLLRKNLLRKLGYKIPPVKYLKSLKVQFKTALQRNDLLTDFEASVYRDKDRWVTSAPEGGTFFYAQDVIIMEDQNAINNLSVGMVSADDIDGRRSLNSLLIPYALTDIPESINMLSWVHGRIYAENVLMPYEHGESFNPTNDDAVWMAKRIMALSETDWLEIVENSHLPGPVAALLYEKLKSRRNHLSTLFSLKTKKFKVETKLNDQDGTIKDGNLQQEFFEGYGRRFKIPDPDSPLSYGEMSSLITTKLINQGIELLVGAFNSSSITGTDVDGKLAKINTEVAAKATKALQEGKPLKGLVDSYAFPMASGRLILSRDIIAGSYLGTDNDIQLVDTIGITVNAGMFGGLSGIFSQTGSYNVATKAKNYAPVGVSGSATASFTRSYAHIKPILSVKLALKYPFKNILIPMLKNKQSKTLKKEAERDFDKINELVEKERNAEYDKIYEAISTQLDVGESVIVTDSISIGAAADASVKLYNVINARLKVGGNSILLSRLHILRKSKTVVQVYKDLGQNNGYEVTIGVDAVVPVIKVSMRGNAGTARTKFYNVSLTPGSKDFKEKLTALSSVIKHNSLNQLHKQQKPYVIKHNFKERNPGAGALVFRWNHVNSVDKITVEAPNGDEKRYLRRYKGYSIGTDFESYVQDIISLFSSKALKTQFSPTSFSKNNPGFTFQGRAFNKIQVFEGELDKDDKVQKPYTRLTRVWNGWQIKQKKAINILNDIKERYKFNFIPEEVLAQTKKFFLYNFSVGLYVHKEGIKNFMGLDEKAIKDLFFNHQSRDMTNYTGEDALKFSGVKRIISWQEKYKKHMEKNNLNKASNYVLKIVSLLEKKMTIAGYESAFGGKQNFLLMARMEGFRIGDANGDQPLVSNTFGMLGNDSLNGPTSEILEFFRYTGSETMTEGEFYVNWMLGRLI